MISLGMRRLRLAHFQVPRVAGLGPSMPELIGIPLAELAAPLSNRFVSHRDTAGEEELFHVAIAEAKPEIEPDCVADDFDRKAVILIAVDGGCVHAPSMAHQASARQAAHQVDNSGMRGTPSTGHRSSELAGGRTTQES